MHLLHVMLIINFLINMQTVKKKKRYDVIAQVIFIDKNKNNI